MGTNFFKLSANQISMVPVVNVCGFSIRKLQENSGLCNSSSKNPCKFGASIRPFCYQIMLRIDSAPSWC